MNKPDDLELVQKFVEGKLSFSANQNLRIEPSFDTAQLLAKKGELIATAKLVGKIRAVLVRQSSTYQELVNRVLVSQQYIPTDVNDRGLIQYEHCPIPEGYEANYTEVRQLWKAWRSHYRHHSDCPLLVRSGQSWLPVQNIEFGQDSTFFIQVPEDEKMLCSTDRIIWLSPAELATSTTLPG